MQLELISSQTKTFGWNCPTYSRYINRNVESGSQAKCSVGMSNDNVYKDCQTTFVHHIAVFDVRKDPWLQCLSFYSYAQACLYVAQWRRCRSGWSGLAGPLFRWSLVPFSDCWDILTIGPGAPRKLTFALCVRIVPAFSPVDQAEPCAAHVFRSYK